MKLAGSHTFAFPRTVVWAALMDPAVLARTLPGCERLERVGAEDRFAGALQVAVGPVKGQFQGTLDLTELHPPERYRMRLDGQGTSGFVKGEGAIWLEEVPAGTALHYDLDAEVGGRLAGVGQRLLESSARSVAKQGLAGLEAQLRARAEAAAAAEAAAGRDALAGEGVAATAAAPGAGEVVATHSPEGAGEAGVDPGSPAAGAEAARLAAARVPGASTAAAAPPAAAPRPPSTAAFAGRVARDVAADLVPPAVRPWLLLGAAGLLTLVVVLLVRSCS